MKFLFLFFVCLYIVACNNGHRGNEIISTTPDKLKESNAGDSWCVNNGNSIVPEIIGSWALEGMKNITFIIDSQKITYPDSFASYRYSISGDSLKILYDDYSGYFAISMKGKDTLILKNGAAQTYLRALK